MSHACVAFGPGDSYLFSTSYGWRCKDLPPAIQSLFSGPHRAKDVHEIALGPDGSYAVVFVDQMGVRRFLGHEVAKDLEDWVVGPGRDLDAIDIALGPDRAFFAMDSTGAIWDELPEAFDKDVKALLNPLGGWKLNKNPTSVSFGPDGDYVFITKDGCAGFHLNDDYPAALKKYVVERQFFGLKNTCIVLNPSRLGTYLILNGEGLAEGAFPPHCVAHFQEFSREWQVFCKNAKVDATNAVLERSGSHVRVPRVPMPSSGQSPPSASPPPAYGHRPNRFNGHGFAAPGRPWMQALHQMSNSGSSGGSNGGSAGNYGGWNPANGGGGGGGGGGNFTAELINHLVNASNNVGGGNDGGNGYNGGGDGTAAFLNGLVNASNGGYSGNGGSAYLNGMLNNGGGSGTAGFDPTGMMNAGSFFDPTSILTGAFFC